MQTGNGSKAKGLEKSGNIAGILLKFQGKMLMLIDSFFDEL